MGEVGRWADMSSDDWRDGGTRRGCARGDLGPPPPPPPPPPTPPPT